MRVCPSEEEIGKICKIILEQYWKDDKNNICIQLQYGSTTTSNQVSSATSPCACLLPSCVGVLWLHLNLCKKNISYNISYCNTRNINYCLKNVILECMYNSEKKEQNLCYNHNKILKYLNLVGDNKLINYRYICVCGFIWLNVSF